MKTTFKTTICLSALGLMLAGQAWAQEGSENRAIDAKVVKVGLGGAIDVTVRQGPTATMVVYGDQAKLSRIHTVVSGDTLYLDGPNREFSLGIGGGKHSRVELTLPDLKELLSNGLGDATISEFNGEQLHLVLSGAGNINLTGNFKQLDARLNGLGNMDISVAGNDTMDLRLSGAGHIKTSGQSKNLLANVSGVGNLDAKKLQTDSATVNLGGFGNVSVFARQSVHLNLGGLGNADVYGQPSVRDVQSSGMGKINWK